MDDFDIDETRDKREKSNGSKKKKVEKSKGSKTKKVDNVDASTSPKNEKTVKFDTQVSPKEENSAKADVLAAASKSPRKEEKGVDVSIDRAPPKLVRKVMELGMAPLYADLIGKLKMFMEHDRYMSCAVDDVELYLRVDITLFTPEELYVIFMLNTHKGGAHVFQSFLLHYCLDPHSWDCMVNFEQMKNEHTSYMSFMTLFKAVINVYPHLPIAEETAEEFEALEKLYGKCKDLDLKAAWKKF